MEKNHFRFPLIREWMASLARIAYLRRKQSAEEKMSNLNLDTRTVSQDPSGEINRNTQHGVNSNTAAIRFFVMRGASAKQSADPRYTCSCLWPA
jgi:hypothetical protein